MKKKVISIAILTMLLTVALAGPACRGPQATPPMPAPPTPVPPVPAAAEAPKPSPPPDPGAMTAPTPFVEPMPAPAPANPPAAADERREFCASKNSEVYHDCASSCVKKITPANLVRFKDRAEAEASGRRPCKNCKP
jgi:hypothetical protein